MHMVWDIEPAITEGLQKPCARGKVTLWSFQFIKSGNHGIWKKNTNYWKLMFNQHPTNTIQAWDTGCRPHGAPPVHLASAKSLHWTARPGLPPGRQPVQSWSNQENPRSLLLVSEEEQVIHLKVAGFDPCASWIYQLSPPDPKSLIYLYIYKVNMHVYIYI